MADPSLEKRYHELIELVSTYSYEYHVLDNPSVSDAVYDSLVNEIKDIETKNPSLIVMNSPTQRVGESPRKGFEKHQHKTRMMSLLDCFGTDDAQAWYDRIVKLKPSVKDCPFWVDPKKDGLACALHYEDGILVRAVTRGDGKVGEIVTQNVKTIPSVPLKLRGKSELSTGFTEVRGEIIMTKKSFAELNEKQQAAGQDLYANPRNTAAGTIRQLDSRLVAERSLEFYAYDLLRDNPEEIPTVEHAYSQLKSIGFKVDKLAHKESDLASVLKYTQTFDALREDLPFHTDGLVVKINDRELFKDLGSVGKNPRGAFAYKYPAEQATTVVRDITISIGRTGAATPVAVFDPVVIAGTTVKHASLHNADEIERKDIRIGDTVVIFKAGDIIPQVESVVKELRPSGAKRFSMEHELNKQFPEETFERPEGEAVYRLKGANSNMILKRSLQHYASRGALDIDGLGEKNVNALVDAGLIQDIADLYILTEEQVIKLERFAELSAKNLVAAIQKKKSPPLDKFIFGLGIRHVGAQTAIDLANEFKRLDSLGTASLEDLRAVDGVGDIVADSLYIWFDEPDNQELLAKLKSIGVWPEEVQASNKKLQGISFAITGTLSSMSRDEAAELIRRNGGKFQSSVGKDTAYLVAGGKVGASKRVKAEKYGTEIINEEKFLEIIKE